MKQAIDVAVTLTAAATTSKDVEGFLSEAARALQEWLGAVAVAINYDGPDTTCSGFSGTPQTEGTRARWSWADETTRSSAVLEISPAPLEPDSEKIESVFAMTGALAKLVAEREAAVQAVQRVEALLDASPFPSALINSTAVVIRANAPFATLVGIRDMGSLAAGAISSPAHGTETGLPESLLEAVQSCTAWTGALTLQAGSAVRSCDAVLTPVGQQTGELLLVLHDRTDDLSAQRETIAREKLATAGEIASGVAHEVNNPLAAIRIEAELIAAGSDNQDTVDSAQVIVREVDRASRIAKMLIHLTRRPDRDSRLVNVNELMREVLDLRSQLDNWARVELRVGLEPSVREVVAPVTDLRQVFFNLITNAEDAVEGRDGAVIEVSSEHCGDTVRISVSDSGPGVPANMRQRVFDPFFTTKDPDKGSGLGLSLSHGVVAELGGKMWVEDSQLGGARFVVELPYELST